MKKRLGRTPCVATLLILLALAAGGATRPPRDFLTPKEEELVKEAQILDKRVEVYIKAAERRLLVLAGPTTEASGKQVQKDSEKWGELPTGTRTELIMDVANILDAAVTNIDDVALRDEKNSLIPKALRKLSAAATRFQSQLVSLSQRTEVASERRALEQVEVNIQEILEAASRLPPEETKKEKGKNKN